MRTQSILIDSPAKLAKAAAWLAKIPFDEIIELEIRPYKQTRSQKANRRYFKIVGLIAETTGHDKDEIHEWLKQKFLGRKKIGVIGEDYEVAPSSATLNVKDFAQFMEQVEAFAITTLGVWLDS